MDIRERENRRRRRDGFKTWIQSESGSRSSLSFWATVYKHVVVSEAPHSVITPAVIESHSSPWINNESFKRKKVTTSLVVKNRRQCSLMILESPQVSIVRRWLSLHFSAGGVFIKTAEENVFKICRKQTESRWMVWSLENVLWTVPGFNQRTLELHLQMLKTEWTLCILFFFIFYAADSDLICSSFSLHWKRTHLSGRFLTHRWIIISCL